MNLLLASLLGAIHGLISALGCVNRVQSLRLIFSQYGPRTWLIRRVYITIVVCVLGCVSWVHVRACSIVYLGFRNLSSWSELYDDGMYFLPFPRR